MRICWVVEGDDAFGTARAVLNLSGRLADEGVDVCFLSVGPGPLVDALVHQGRPVGVLAPAVPLLVSGLDPLRTGGMLGRWLASSLVLGVRLRRHPWVRRSDLLHVLRPNLLLAAGLAKRGGVVWEMANAVGGGPSAAAVYRLLIGTLKIRVLANSSWTGSTLRRHGVPVMHLSADPSQFPATALPREPDPTFLMAARVHPEKMQLEVIRALAEIPVPVRLVVAGVDGDDPYTRAVIEAARTAPGHLSVELRPPTEHVALLMAAADVVIAVRRDPEPFGLTVVEAMMSGRPVVAGAVGGPAETVLDGTGWLLPDLGHAGLVAGLTEMLDARLQWPAMGRKAAAHARIRFTPPVQASRYRGLVGGQV